MQHGRTAQLALTLGAFLGQNVATMGSVALEAAGSGLLESLSRATITLNLRHN